MHMTVNIEVSNTNISGFIDINVRKVQIWGLQITNAWDYFHITDVHT